MLVTSVESGLFIIIIKLRRGDLTHPVCDAIKITYVKRLRKEAMKFINRLFSAIILVITICLFSLTLVLRVQPEGAGSLFPAMTEFINKYNTSVRELPSAASKQTTSSESGNQQSVYIPSEQTTASDDSRTFDFMFPAPTGVQKVDSAIRTLYEKDKKAFIQATDASSGANLFIVGECFESNGCYSVIRYVETDGSVEIKADILNSNGKRITVADAIGEKCIAYFADYLENNLHRFKSIAGNLSDNYLEYVSANKSNYDNVLIRSDGTADVIFSKGEILNTDSDVVINIPLNVISGEYYNRRRIDPNAKMVALTFDDGPDDKYTPRIQDCLEKYGAVATFFDIGWRVDEFPEVTARSVAIGCEVGSHTYNHINLQQSGKETLESDKALADAAFTKAIGYVPTLVRPPWGAIGGIAKYYYDNPYIGWSIDTLDWQTLDVSSTVNKVKYYGNLNGQIILMHGVYDSSATAAEILIPWLINQGYELVTVSELFEYHYDMILEPHIYYAVDFLLYGVTPV